MRCIGRSARPDSPMRHPPTFRTALLAFLLVAMQQAAQWHALDHFGEWLQRPHEPALLAQQADLPCAVCALFAGGASAAPRNATAAPFDAVGVSVPAHAAALLATAAPSPYLIRAPPALL